MGNLLSSSSPSCHGGGVVSSSIDGLSSGSPVNAEPTTILISSDDEDVVDEVLAANAEQVENYRNADASKQPKMLGFFVGQIMKKSQGKADPRQVNALLQKKLG